MRILRKITLAISAGLLSNLVASARPIPASLPEFNPTRTLYVAPYGDDSASGLSLETPLRTISAAALITLPGDLVLVRGGVYLEHVTMRRAGTAARPIVFRAMPGETALVTSAQNPEGWQPVPGMRNTYEAPFEKNPLFVMEGRELCQYFAAPEMETMDDFPGSYIYDANRKMLLVHPMHGLDADDAAITVVGLTTSATAKGLWPFAEHNRVEGFHVAFQPYGIQLRADGTEARGNTVYGCAVQGIQSYTGLNTIIANNISFKNDSTGIHVANGADGATIAGNISWGNTPRGALLSDSSGGHPYQLALYGSSVPNPIVQGNLVLNGITPYERGDRLMRYKHATGISQTRNNMLLDGKPQSEWGPGCANDHNTVLGGKLHTYNENALITPEGAAARGSTAINNLYLEKTDIENAGFADTARFDYRLRADSPHIGTGAWPAAAPVRYVSPTGNDGSQGLAPHTAWRTLAKAAAAAQPGTTIYVMPGTYTESVTIDTQSAADKPLEFLTYGNGKVVIDGQGTHQHAFLLLSAQNLRIDGFIFKNHSRYAIAIMGGDSIELRNNIFDSENSAIKAESAGCLIAENNTFTDCAGTFQGRNLQTRLELRNNLFQDCDTPPVDLDTATRAVLVSERNGFAGHSANGQLAAWRSQAYEPHPSIVADTEVAAPDYLLPPRSPLAFAGIGHKPLGARPEAPDTSPIPLEDFRVLYAAPDTAILQWFTPQDYPNATLTWQAPGVKQKKATIDQYKFGTTLRYARYEHKIIDLAPGKLYTAELNLNDPDGRTRSASLQFSTPSAHQPPKTLYVSKEGDDDNDGLSPATAVRSIAAAMHKCSPAYTVIVGEGVYNEMVEPVCGGINEQQRLVIRSEPVGAAVIDAGELRPGAFDLTRVSHVTLDGFKVRGLVYSSLRHAVNLSYVDDIMITRFNFEGKRDGSDGVTCRLIAGSQINNLKVYDNLLRSGFYNMRLSSADNITIDHNTFYLGGVCAIQLTGAVDANYTISNNIFYDVIAAAKSNPAIMIDRPTANLVLERNLYFRAAALNMGLYGNLYTTEGAKLEWSDCARTVAELVQMFGVGGDNLVADPLFRGLHQGDFSLRAGSPARGMAADGTDAGMLSLFPIDSSYQGAFHWTAAGGTRLWRTPGNWDPDLRAPSTTNDIAIFDSSPETPQTVKLDEDNTIGGLIVRNDHIRLDMQGHTQTLAIPAQSITDGNNQTGVIEILNGSLVAHRNLINSAETPYLYIGNGGTRTVGRMIVSGPDTEFDTNLRMHLAQSTGSIGELVIEDGARVAVQNGGAFVVGSAGQGLLSVSNSTLTTTTATIGNGKNAQGKVILSGPQSVWMRAPDTNPISVVGSSGRGEVIVEKGAQLLSAMQYMVIGKETGSEGVVTVVDENSVIGGPADSGAISYAVTLGATAKGTMAAPPSPDSGGIGTLNLLDGGSLQGRRGGTQCYFYIGTGSRIRIRDGFIRWCAEGNRDSPFFFRPGAFYNIQLTSRTHGFTNGGQNPIILSGADKAGGRGNIITDAILEIELLPGYTHHSGAAYNIFEYSGDLIGEFAGLEEGAEFKVDLHRFRINYGQRSNSRITLTAMPPENSLILLR